VSRYLLTFSPFTRAKLKLHTPKFAPITTNDFSAANRRLIVASAKGFDRPSPDNIKAFHLSANATASRSGSCRNAVTPDLVGNVPVIVRKKSLSIAGGVKKEALSEAA
jgi:hypothetical protein